jgi:hypothetical protein
MATTDMRAHAAYRRLAACGLLVCLAGCPRPSAAATPAGQEVVDRVLATIRHTDLRSVDMLIQFRIAKPVTAPPDCVFHGALHVSPERLSFSLGGYTASPVCWLLHRYVLMRLIGDRDRADALLPRFRFTVIGEKLVEGRPHYLVEGRALAAGTDPQWIMGWIDYDHGLVDDASIGYAWGRIDGVQQYSRLPGGWVPVHQYLYVPRASASLEISYTGFRFAPARGGRAASSGRASAGR